MAPLKLLVLKPHFSLSHLVQRAWNQHKINIRNAPLVLLFRPFLFIILPHLEMERWKLSQTQTLVKERPSSKNAVTLEQRWQVWGLGPPICPISFRVMMGTEFASFSSFKQSKCYLLIAGLWFSNCELCCGTLEDYNELTGVLQNILFL